MAKKKKISKKRASTKSTTTASPSSMSTAELQAELQRRERNVKRLERRRERLMEDLAEVEQALAAEGALSATGGIRRRPRNEMNLVDSLATVLKGKEMSGADLYRSRISGPKPTAPRNLGSEINSSSDETNPAIRNAGFQLVFNSDRDDNPNALYSARSKRVVRYHDYSKMPSSEWLSSNIGWLIGFAAALGAFIWLFILAWRKPDQEEAQPTSPDDLNADPAT